MSVETKTWIEIIKDDTNWMKNKIEWIYSYGLRTGHKYSCFDECEKVHYSIKVYTNLAECPQLGEKSIPYSLA